MKTLMILALTVFTCMAQAAWVEGNTVGVRDDNTKEPIAIFLNTYTGVGVSDGVWHRLNVVTDLGMPSGTKSIFLTGLLIITHGTAAATCDLQFAGRAPGNTLAAGNYICQTIEAAIGSGQRSGCATWMPVVNDEIEYQWNKNTTAAYPTGCAYAINLSAQSYVK